MASSVPAILWLCLRYSHNSLGGSTGGQAGQYIGSVITFRNRSQTIVGRLQNLVPATPGNIGATFLCKLYDVLHADDGLGLISTDPSYYYHYTTLAQAAMEDITWWITYLQSGTCTISCPPDPMVLTTTWMDNSGTSTSSTFRMVDGSVVSSLTPHLLQLERTADLSRDAGKGTGV
eukprot:15364943-Ditylum_brightwellii.AAC.2